MAKYYLTTSIAYINSEPHIGYALELLGADTVARYHKYVKEDDTYFLTGADEHGFSVQIHSERAGMEPRKFVDSIIEKFTSLKDKLNLDYDYFVRTTSEEHKKNAVEIWNKVLKNGYIYKKHYCGVYCVGCEAMKNKSDLVDGKCPNHPNLTPEEVEEENWFFKLSAFEDRLKEFYKKNPEFVQPDFRFNEVKSLLEGGLEDVSVSRQKEKLSWGIEVPNDKDQVMYVWFDALTNYLYPKKYWPADLHVIGKDILRFHAALWPAMLMAAGYKDEELPRRIYVHGFITAEGQKMSKTLGNVVKPDELIKRYGQEATRYLMLRELSFDKDSDFSWERFDARYNADLANDLGNLLMRTLVMINKYKVDVKAAGKCDIEKSVNENIEKLDFTKALDEIWQIIRGSNKAIDESKPWELAKTDKRRLADVLGEIYSNLWFVGKLLLPFMPKTSENIEIQLKNLKPEPLFLRLDK